MIRSSDHKNKFYLSYSDSKKLMNFLCSFFNSIKFATLRLSYKSAITSLIRMIDDSNKYDLDQYRDYFNQYF